MSTPIRLISLTLRNFMSYGNAHTTIDLEFKEPTLIIGRNLDAMVNGQIDSNGSGKTTIINALAWGLYGKPISKISQDGLVNNINKKDMEVTVIFEKDGIFYKVFRYRKHSVYGDAGVKIYEANSLDDLLKIKDKSNKKGDEKAEASINLANKQIERIIGMPYDIFTRIVIYSARHEPFFSLPATSAAGKTNQADIMEELTGLTDLSRKGDVLNDEMKTNNRELESLKKVQEEIEKQKTQYQEKIDAIQTRIDQWESVKNNNISITIKKIDELSNIDFDLQRELVKELVVIKEQIKDYDGIISTLVKDITNLETTIQNVSEWEHTHKINLENANNTLLALGECDFDDQEQLLTTVTNKKQELSSLSEKITNISNDIKNRNKKSTDFIDERNHLTENKCPYCKQQYVDATDKISELTMFIETLEAELVDLNNSKNSILSEKQKIEFEIDKSESSLQFKSLLDLNKFKNNMIQAKERVILLESQTNPFNNIDLNESKITHDKLSKDKNKIVKLKDKAFSKKIIIESNILYQDEVSVIQDLNKLNNLQDELTKLQASINPHFETLKDMNSMTFDDSNYKKINELETLVLHQKFLHKLLTHKNSFIRKSLLTKSIKFLNERLKDYLDMLGLPHKVRFTEELTASISQFGNNLDYDNLSSGQQARVNLALSFAFRDVLQKRYGKISFCILDECLDVGLGGVGVQMAAKMIKNIASKDKLSMFIISHRDEITNLFPKAMEIELDKGFSKIIKI